MLPHPYAFNLFSHNAEMDADSGHNGEELKVIAETRKILDAPELPIGITCIRVPVLRTHAMAISVTFDEEMAVGEARALLAAAPGLRVVDDPARNYYPDAVGRHRAGRRAGRTHPAGPRRPDRADAGAVRGWRSAAEGGGAERGADRRALARGLTLPALLLALLTALRLAVAAATPLSPDEAYYWVWSRALQPGYLDHPPMVALWIRLGTALAGDTALGVRLLGPLAAAVGSWMLADAADRLYPGRRYGVPAATLLNATLMLGVGAVTMTPDTPLLFFAVVTLWALARVEVRPAWWLVVGVAIGLAMDSKYTGTLLAAGPVLWVAGSRRWAVLRSPWPWLGGLVSVLLFAPVIWWNAQHGWASFAKQGGRTGNWAPQQAVQHLLELVGGQIGLATPIVFVLMAAGLWRAGKAAWRGESAGLLLSALAVPGLLVFAEHAIGARVQANWLAILYPPLAVGGATVLTGWRRTATGLGLALTAVVYVQAVFAPLPLPRKSDPTLARLGGWPALAAEADAMRLGQGLGFVASEDYGEASELAWWSAPGAVVVASDERWRLFRLPAAAGGTGLLLVSDRRREEPDPTRWSGVEKIGRLTRRRGGVEAEAYRVYRVTMVLDAPAVQLPRPGGK